MLSIRERIRRWLDIPTPAKGELVDSRPALLGKVSKAALAQLPGLVASPQAIASFQGMPVIARPIQPPKLLPGVLPSESAIKAMAVDSAMLPYVALDSATMAPAWEWARSANCGFGFPGYAFLSELAQRTEYRSPVETIAAEMVREWITLTTSGKSAAGAEDKIEKLNAALDKYKIRDLFRRMSEYDGFFGRGQLFIDIDAKVENDERKKLPLLIDSATIPQGSLKGFTPIEPLWTTPYSYNAQDPTAPYFYKPQAWFIMGKMTHASRLLTFISREVPDMLKPAYNFGGLSLTQLMEPYVFQWLRTRNSVSDLIHNFSVMVLKTNMAALLQGTAESSLSAVSDAASNLLARAKLFTQTRDNQGLTLLDFGTEEMEQIAVPLSGLDALQAQAQEHMAGPSHIPLVKLFGITPTGLNASSEGEVKVFYDFVRSQQQLLFADPLKKVLDILQLNEFGNIDESISFEFVPLTSPSVKELSDIRKADVDGGVQLVQASVITPDELRERLKSDPDSGYPNLTGEAPEPPDPMGGLDPETGEPMGGPPGAGKPPPKKDDNE